MINRLSGRGDILNFATDHFTPDLFRLRSKSVYRFFFFLNSLMNTKYSHRMASSILFFPMCMCIDATFFFVKSKKKLYLIQTKIPIKLYMRLVCASGRRCNAYLIHSKCLRTFNSNAHLSTSIFFSTMLC